MNPINILIVVLLGLALVSCKAIKSKSPVIIDATQTNMVEVPPSSFQSETIELICNTDLDHHEVEPVNVNSKYPTGPITSLDFFDFNATMDQWGIASACLPKDIGAPYIPTDWDSEDGTAQSGKMEKIIFEEMPNLSLVYSTYNISQPTEYDTFATSLDYDGIKNSSQFFFDRISTGVCYGRCNIFKTRIFPSFDHYVAVVLDLGAYEYGATLDEIVSKFNAGVFPPELAKQVELFNKTAEGIQMK